MKVLALESSTERASLAALEDGRVLGEFDFGSEQRTAQSFAPTMRKLLDQVGWSPEQLDLIAVSQGPGSFTGLRVGVTAAKTLAYATGAEVLGVDTLEVIAHRAIGKQPLWAVMDGQRQQLFVAQFQPDPENVVKTIRSTGLLDRDAWIAALARDVEVAGPALRRLCGRLPRFVSVCDETLWQPRAGTVGTLAFTQYQQGRRADLWTLLPNYFRKSAAEEKLERS